MTEGVTVMPDREKVLQGLECCARFAESMEFFSKACWDCPYNDNMFSGTCSTVKPLLTDALALLREQEAVPVEWQGIPLCGACKAAFLNLRPQKYCHECGRKVKWDDA